MKGQQVKTIIIQQADINDIQTALDLLRSGQGLTAGESGLAAVDPIANLELIGQPQVVWDGLYYNVFFYISSG
jgi:hypothetical protein